MDVLNSMIAVSATLAGLWTSAILHQVRPTQNETVVMAAFQPGTRSIVMPISPDVRSAPRPMIGEPRR